MVVVAARIVIASDSYLCQNRTPQGGHKQLIQALQTIAESLDDLFEPDMIKVWAERPNPALQGERPKDFAKKPGGILIMAHLLGNLGR